MTTTITDNDVGLRVVYWFYARLNTVGAVIGAACFFVMATFLSDVEQFCRRLLDARQTIIGTITQDGWSFIARRQAMHAERDIVYAKPNNNLSV